MATIANDDLLTFWSRAQYMRREVEPEETDLQAHTSQLYPPNFWLTKRQAQRRVSSSMTHDDRKAYEGRRHSHKKIVSPMRRRGEAVMNSPNKPGVYGRSSTPKTPAKVKTRREKQADARADYRQKIRDRGSWKYVTQAGCSFYYNDTTGMCETEPPDYVRKRGMVRAVEAANFFGKHIAAPRQAVPEPDEWIQQLIDDEQASLAEGESLAEDSFAFMDDWSREGPTRKRW